MRTRTAAALIVTLVTLVSAASCSDSGQSRDAGHDVVTVYDVAGHDVLARDARSEARPCPVRFTENVSGCTPAATDYQPRKGAPGSNGWPTCISDDNTYHLIGSTPSSTARSQAFVTMGTKLWKNSKPPTQADFLSARDDYSVAEGLASRVARRQDISYPEVPGTDKFACQTAGVPEQYPDRCAGPAKLKSIIDDAFVKGSDQSQPLVQAARIEAALLWFFHLSLTSEIWTCGFSSIKDCDSAMAYYTQVSARDAPVGHAQYVAAIGPETHNRVYDALLAARCWRDIDQAMPATAANKKYYDLAQAQLNRASLRGMALILRDRIGRILCTSGEAQQAHIELVKILGGLIDHGASGFDAAKAAQLRTYTSSPTADTAAVTAAQAAIDAIFACP